MGVDAPRRLAVERVRAIVLILLGALLGILFGYTLLMTYAYCLVNPASPDYYLQKLRMLFSSFEMGTLTLSCLVGVLAGLFLVGRGIFLLLLHTPSCSSGSPSRSPR
jgi:hypothetical protein